MSYIEMQGPHFVQTYNLRDSLAFRARQCTIKQIDNIFTQTNPVSASNPMVYSNTLPRARGMSRNGSWQSCDMGTINIDFQPKRVRGCVEQTYIMAKRDFYGEDHGICNTLWGSNGIATRQMKALLSGYLSDCTFLVGPSRETVRCHSTVLSMASPKFANMLKGKRKEHPILLPGIHAPYFRKMLEYIYTDQICLEDLETTIGVGRIAYIYKISALVSECNSHAMMRINEDNVCQVMEFAEFMNRYELKEFCMKFIRDSAKRVLQGEGFPKSEFNTLVSILRDDKLQQVTELDLFDACLRWCQDYPNPRQAIDYAIGLVRFRAISPSDFAKHVGTKGLLTVQEERDILHSLLTNEDMPTGFSNEKLQRWNSSSSHNPDENYNLLYEEVNYSTTVMTTESIWPINVCKERSLRFRTMPLKTSMLAIDIAKKPLVFTMGQDTYICGVKLFACRCDDGDTRFKHAKNVLLHKKYDEHGTVVLKNDDGSIVSVCQFDKQVTYGNLLAVRFNAPALVKANTIYHIFVQYIVPNDTRFRGVQKLKEQKVKKYKLVMNVKNLCFTSIQEILVAKE